MFKFTLPFLFISCFSFSQVPTASFSASNSTACFGATNTFTNNIRLDSSLLLNAGALTLTNANLQNYNIVLRYQVIFKHK